MVVWEEEGYQDVCVRSRDRWAGSSVVFWRGGLKMASGGMDSNASSWGAGKSYVRCGFWLRNRLA